MDDGNTVSANFLEDAIRLAVDATDILRGIFRVKIGINISRTGRVALAYPK